MSVVEREVEKMAPEEVDPVDAALCRLIDVVDAGYWGRDAQMLSNDRGCILGLIYRTL